MKKEKESLKQTIKEMGIIIRRINSAMHFATKQTKGMARKQVYNMLQSARMKMKMTRTVLEEYNESICAGQIAEGSR